MAECGCHQNWAQAALANKKLQSYRPFESDVDGSELVVAASACKEKILESGIWSSVQLLSVHLLLFAPLQPCVADPKQPGACVQLA